MFFLALACGACASSPARTDEPFETQPSADGGRVDGGPDAHDVRVEAPGDAGCGTTVPSSCDETWAMPPKMLKGWSAVFSQTGSLTLTHDTAHVHDDGKGPLGFCAANVMCGEKYLALVSARFETDQDLGDNAHCVVDYTQPDATLSTFGMCWSGGNHHIYAEIRDENDKRIMKGEGIEVVTNGNTWSIPDGMKPAAEFPINHAIYGGGVRYLVRATYAGLKSDAVTNIRLPLNHHVNFLFSFRITTR